MGQRSFTTSYPNHKIVGEGKTFAPMYMRNGQWCFYYELADKKHNSHRAVVRKSYEAAWNYIASRNNAAANRRARRGR